jgi:endonuclease YncB( thermonuclease family)
VHRSALFLLGLCLLFVGCDGAPTTSAYTTSRAQAETVAVPTVPTPEISASHIKPTESPIPTVVKMPTHTHTQTSTLTPTLTATAEPTETSTPTSTPTHQPRRIAAQVIKVVDGDTIEVLIGDQARIVQYSDVLAPLGPESLVDTAQAANQELVAGKVVYLEEAEPLLAQTDRWYCHVYLADGTFVNQELVRRGYAAACPSYDSRYGSILYKTAQEAAVSGSGLWSPASPASHRTSCLEMVIPRTTIEIGEILPITLTLSNSWANCGSFGNIDLSVDAEPGLFLPANLGPTWHRVVIPGDSHQVELRLMAVAPGQAAITAHAGFEVHHIFDFSGSMTGCSSGPVEIAIMPGPGRILFHSDNDAQPGYWIMDPNGKGRTYLAPDFEFQPHFDRLREAERFSPDGRFQLIVGKADPKHQIFVQPAKPGTVGNLAVRQITHLSGLSYDPVWSPAGNRIAFVSQENGGDDIWVVDSDGSGARWLFKNSWEWDKHPSWSPDGSQIAFWSNQTGLRQIYVIDANGGNARNISNSAWEEYDPIWIK